MDCPKVNCSEPVLLAGRCCKICPGENQSKLHFIHFFLLLYVCISVRKARPDDFEKWVGVKEKMCQKKYFFNFSTRPTQFLDIFKD